MDETDNAQSSNVRTSPYRGGAPVLFGLVSLFGWSALAQIAPMPAWMAQGGCWFWAAVFNFLYVQWLGPDADRFTFYFIKLRYWTVVFLVFTVIAVNANAN